MKDFKRLFIKSISFHSALFFTCLSLVSCAYNSKPLTHEEEYISENSSSSETTSVTTEVQTDSPLSYLGEPLDGPFEVERVIDGDTIVVNIDDESVHVRLIGIDAPESVSPNEELNCEEGIIASERTHSIISSASNTVYLEYDDELYDQYGRLLAYVYIYDSNGEYLLPGSYVMVEEILLREGLASTLMIEPNDRYIDFFEECHN